MTRAKIIGVGAYAPKRVLTNADLEKMVDTNDEWIVQRSGIRERHIVDENEATSDLAVKAAQQALERANLVPEDIDFIVVGTTTPDMFFPTVGNIVQHRLGCGRAGSVDMLAACAGSIYSLAIGAQFIQTGKYRRVLCIGAETLSRITDFTDRGTCILLADAAGAVVLEATEDGSGIIDADLYSDGKYWELLYMPGGGARHPATHETVDPKLHYARMKGNEVFKVAVRMFVECTETILSAQRLHRGRRGPVHPAPGQPAHHRGGLQAREPAHGSRVRQRRPLRQHRGGLGLRRPGGGRRRGPPASRATSCSWPPSAAASPGARPSCGGRRSARSVLTAGEERSRQLRGQAHPRFYPCKRAPLP